MAELVADRVRFRYSDATPLLIDRSLSVPPGARLAVLGRNGAGKTTLLRLLAGLLEPEHGSVTIRDAPAGPGVCTFVPAEAPVDPNLTRDEHLTLMATLWSLRGAVAADYHDRVEHALDALELAHNDEPVGTYSLGMRGKLALALLLATPHRMLLLDEPCSAFDRRATDAAVDLLTKHSAQALVAFSSHDHALVEALATVTLDLDSPTRQETP